MDRQPVKIEAHINLNNHINLMNEDNMMKKLEDEYKFV